MRRAWAALIAVCGLLAACAGGEAAKAPAPSAAAKATTTASSAASPATTATRVPRPRRTPVTQALRTTGCGTDHASGEMREEVETPEGARSYLLHVPPGYNSRRAMPLVLSFHGYAQNAAQQEAYSGLNVLADSQGFIVVTPEGSGSPQGWNVYGVYDEDGVDDVAFAQTLIEHLGETLCLDAKRIYATGHSNGAEMASQLACQLPGLVAAVAPVSGAVFQDCQGPGVPVIAFQGTADYNVPYEDSEAGIEGWVGHNGCPADADVSRPAENVELRSWKCTDGDVEFYVIEGGGHTWPGADPALGGVGPTTDEINASELMWAFFKAHPKKGS